MRMIIFFCTITVLALVGIILLLRSGRLKEKYAILWAVVGLLCLILVAFPRALSWSASLVGIAVPSNLLFALAILLLLAICLQLSLEISGQEEKVRRLAEEVAILRAQIENGHGRPDEDRSEVIER
ncbi:MAG: DUF2304 domain-containing protein [Propionibacteriaceae bacterium]|jgi:hypothetical protein|nr:DUF2304 domain-containing protein [Propionibacteriaceae bacterium]